MAMGINKIKLSELTPDPRNANRGTERGRYMVEHSLRKLGAGRSILADKNGVVIAGNKTLESAVESGFENAIVVETDGTALVVVKRTDLDMSDAKAKELAIADNRSSQVSLDFDPEVLLELDEENDLGDWFRDDELEALLSAIDGEATEYQPPEPGQPGGPPAAPDDADDTAEGRSPAEKYPLAIVLDFKQHQRKKAALEAFGFKSDKELFIKLLEEVGF